MVTVMKRVARDPAEDILGVIGNTPMVALARLARGLQPTIYAKLEFMNPGGSVKDRIATFLVRDAERTGLLKKGGTIVEPTSGNTGIGLAMLAAVRGYKAIFTMPDKVSEEKRALLRAYGAKIVIAPTDVPQDSPEHYVNVARRISGEIAGAYMPNQYTNPGNPEAHYATTGPEIWEQTEGQLDALVATVGTGGTISGVGRFLKERGPVSVVGVEPVGSIYHNVKYGTDYPLHPYLVEGIGEDFVPETYDPRVVDQVIQVSDKETFDMTRRLASEEGILAGGSSGAAVAGAVKFAEGPGRSLRKIVVILPDTGRNYLSKTFNDEWLGSNGLRDPTNHP
jgi:cystathionine beta-synthase